MPTKKKSRGKSRGRKRSRGTAPLTGAAKFFYQHGGYSYKRGQSKELARRQAATSMAAAEAYAEAHGWHVDWEEDLDEYQMGDLETEHPKEVLTAVLRDANNKVLASLGAIGDPSRTYARIVEAELALEAMPGK